MRAKMMASSFVAMLALVGCGEDSQPIPELSVAEVATLIESGDAVAVDANGEETRRERGTLPGARLLSSSSEYSLSELPGDHSTHLVFYCGGEMCHASDSAAERARENGYEHVSVMRAGIAGWVEAGRPVDRPQS